MTRLTLIALIFAALVAATATQPQAVVVTPAATPTLAPPSASVDCSPNCPGSSGRDAELTSQFCFAGDPHAPGAIDAAWACIAAQPAGTYICPQADSAWAGLYPCRVLPWATNTPVPPEATAPPPMYP